MIDIEIVEKLNERMSAIEESNKILTETTHNLMLAMSSMQAAFLSLNEYVSKIPKEEIEKMNDLPEQIDILRNKVNDMSLKLNLLCKSYYERRY